MTPERSPLFRMARRAGVCAAVLCAMVSCFAFPSVQARAGYDGNDSLFDTSTTPAELLAHARDAFGLGDLDLASRYYQELLVREPTNVQVILELSNVYEQDGRLEYARGLLTRASVISPENPHVSDRLRNVNRLLSRVLDREIDELWQAGRLEEALPRMSLLLSIEPDNTALMARRARCLLDLGQIRAAGEAIERTIALDPDSSYRALSDRIARMEHAENVKRLTARARALVDSVRAHALIDSIRSSGQQSAAAVALAKLLHADPENEWAQNAARELPSSESPLPPDTSAFGAAGHAAGNMAGAAASRLLSGLRIAGSALIRALTIGYVTAQRFPSVLPSAFIVLALVLILRSPLVRGWGRTVAEQPLLSGQLNTFSLPEVIHLLRSENHTGVLGVRVGRQLGKIYVDDGEVVHCVADKSTGRDALLALLSAPASGTFSFRASDIPDDRTIDASIDLILIEHARASLPPRGGGPRRKQKQKSRVKELLENRSR